MSPVGAVIIVYFLLTFSLAWYFSRRESLEEYFLNARSSGLWLLVCSNVATIVGAGATVGVVAEGARTGISFGAASAFAYLAGTLLLAALANRIRTLGQDHNVVTIVDFFRLRFGTPVAVVAGAIQLVLLLIWIAVQAAATGTLASMLFGTDYGLALWCSAAVTIVYTGLGGLKIDIITDFIQFWIMAVVFAVLSLLAHQRVGGMEALLSSLPEGHLDLLSFGGAGWLAGAVVLGCLMYPANSSHWQRIISARSSGTARASLLLSVPLLLLFASGMLFLGLAAAAILPAGSGDAALFMLMEELSSSPLLLGCGYAAVLATIMSSVDSLLIGGSTIVFKAFFTGKNGNAAPLRSARFVTLAFGLTGFVIAYLVPAIVTLSLLTAYIAITVVPALLAGLFSQRFSTRFAFWALVLPFGALLLIFPFAPKNSFLFSTALSLVITALGLAHGKFCRG